MFAVRGLELRVSGFELEGIGAWGTARVMPTDAGHSTCFGVQVLGFRVEDLGCRVEGQSTVLGSSTIFLLTM